MTNTTSSESRLARPSHVYDVGPLAAVEGEGDVVGAEHHQPRRHRHRLRSVQQGQRLGILFGVSPLPGAVGVGRRLRRVPDRLRRLRPLKELKSDKLVWQELTNDINDNRLFGASNAAKLALILPTVPLWRMHATYS